MSRRRVLIFSRFERFWHWSQMVLIFLLLFSGFDLHGSYEVLEFKHTVTLHTVAAIALSVLWLLAIFWHLTTGTWRHYIPTTDGLWRVARFYAYDVFKGERHPYRKAYWRKHNPLQALTYLALKLLLFPLLGLSGLLYLFTALWGCSGDGLMLVALLHTAAAFAMLIFIIAHLYLLTTGQSFKGHLMPMINGFDEVELTPEEEAYLEQDLPQQLK